MNVRRYRDALAEWNDPGRYGFGEWFELYGRKWALRNLVARGAVSDVYLACRARWPTRWVVVKLLRDNDHAARFDREGGLLTSLGKGNADWGTRAPKLVQRGRISAGAHLGRDAILYMHEADFSHTFAEVRRAFPGGVDPRVGLWMWRRILEVLAPLHRQGLAHGAIVPTHLLVQERDHGVRVIGFGCAGAPGEPLQAKDPGFASMDPDARTVSFERDVEWSARCIAYVLGGDPPRGDVPSQVPKAFADRIREVAHGNTTDAWSLREELGSLAQRLFGPPAFVPLVMPS